MGVHRGRSPDHRERREKEKVVYKGLHEKNTYLKPLIRKMSGADYLELFQVTELKD